MSGTTWTFPLPLENPLNPTEKILWTTTTADDVVLAALNTPGAHIQTASTTEEPFRLAGSEWQKLNFSSSEVGDLAISGWTADPDGDGYTNLDEYAFGLRPKLSDTLEMSQSIESSYLEPVPTVAFTV